MTLFVPESIKVLGSDAGGASVVLCDMFVDDLADLPAPTAYTGYKLSMGCRAIVINDNSVHRLNSAGQWVQIMPGNSTYTRAEIDSMIARIDATEAEDRAALIAQVDGGAKNKLNYTLATFGNRSMITFNPDGSITGTITSDTRQFTWNNREFEFTLPAGNYVMCINRINGDGAYTSARLMTANDVGFCTVSTNPNIAPSTKSFVLNANTTVGFMGKVFSDTITIMICTAADWAVSQKFVPYALQNPTLTPAVIEAVDEGAKNLLKITATTQTINGVTFTVNADQTITINGTSKERAQFLLRPITVYSGMQGCILSGAAQNDKNVTLRFQLGGNPWTVYANDSGSGSVIKNYDDSSPIQVYINVPVGVTVSNLIFKPMICTAADYAVSPAFVPYAPTNRELYEMIKQYHP